MKPEQDQEHALKGPIWLVLTLKHTVSYFIHKGLEMTKMI